jgi:hypothetical protein
MAACLLGSGGSNPTGDMDVVSCVCMLCCPVSVETSATG